MDTNRWKATIVLSSDHAGINNELGSLENELLHSLAHIEDPRKVRDFLLHLRLEAALWCDRNGIDTRGWMERTRKVKDPGDLVHGFGSSGTDDK